jgi:hypothetical protein
MANSFASLSAAFAWGTLAFGIVAFLAALGWGYFIRHWAKEEARKAAKEEVELVAEGIMNEWLTTTGMALLRQASQMSQPATANGQADVANEIAANADDPES